VAADERGWITWSAVGSLNGDEVSHKVNRPEILVIPETCQYSAGNHTVAAGERISGLAQSTQVHQPVHNAEPSVILTAESPSLLTGDQRRELDTANVIYSLAVLLGLSPGAIGINTNMTHPGF
jgi:hypothetical protein